MEGVDRDLLFPSEELLEQTARLERHGVRRIFPGDLLAMFLCGLCLGINILIESAS